MTQDPAEAERQWAAFDPGNVGSYPGRVERIIPGANDAEILDIRATDDRKVSLVSLMLSFRPGGASQVLRTPFARLQWGVSGGRDEAFIDWIHGQVITLAASFVRIAATFPGGGENVNPPGFPPEILPSNFGPPGSPTQQELDESLLLGINAAPNPHAIAAFGATPRLTTFHNVPAAGADPGLSDFIPIPSHAQSVTLLGTFAPGQISLVTASSIDNSGAVLYSTANPAPNLDQFAFPIARGVEFIQLTNVTDEDILVLLLWTIGL
jgi:hypothetical protein